VKDIHDVITRAKFGDNRLRGSWAVVGQISAFPIDFAGRPYNTLTLPCERVITHLQTQYSTLELPSQITQSSQIKSNQTLVVTHKSRNITVRVYVRDSAIQV